MNPSCDVCGAKDLVMYLVVRRYLCGACRREHLNANTGANR